MSPQPPLILNVDDAGASRYVISRILSRAGYRIQEADSGNEALRLLDGAATPPDLVLLDVNLPDIDGFEVCRRIKNSRRLSRIPVLQHSALYTQPEARARGLEGGADGYLVTPVDPLELVASVRALLRAREVDDREARLREVLSAAEVGTLDCNLVTHQVEWSPNCPALLGMCATEFDGGFTTYRHRLDPRDAIRLEAEAAEAQKLRRAYVCEYRIAAANGETRWIEERGRFFYNDAGAATHHTRVLSDVTARRMIEHTCRANEERLQLALAHAPISAYATDRSLHPTWGYAPTCGGTPTQPPNRLDEAMLSPEGLARLTALKERVLASGAAECIELEHVAPDGELRSWRIAVDPLLPAGGEPSGLLVVTTDQSPVKRFADELRRATLAKDEALATVAHELRNPLTAIRNAAYLLSRSEIDSASRARALAVIERQVRQQARLIDDLLDVARLGRGKLELQLREVDLGPSVRSIVADFGAVGEAAGVLLMLDLPEQPLRMRADPARLTQVVSNLLDNAIKFTPSGGSVVVRLTEHPSRDRAELSIQDTGIGMEAGFAARAFESFAQQESGRDRRSGGLGLGLSLVRGLVRLHGGAVQADSDGPGQGCTITLTLPLQTNELVTIEPPPTARSI